MTRPFVPSSLRRYVASSSLLLCLLLPACQLPPRTDPGAHLESLSARQDAALEGTHTAGVQSAEILTEQQWVEKYYPQVTRLKWIPYSLSDRISAEYDRYVYRQLAIWNVSRKDR